jgi:hypothetical protein
LAHHAWTDLGEPSHAGSCVAITVPDLPGPDLLVKPSLGEPSHAAPCPPGEPRQTLPSRTGTRHAAPCRTRHHQAQPWGTMPHVTRPRPTISAMSARQTSRQSAGAPLLRACRSPRTFTGASTRHVPCLLVCPTFVGEPDQTEPHPTHRALTYHAQCWGASTCLNVPSADKPSLAAPLPRTGEPNLAVPSLDVTNLREPERTMPCPSHRTESCPVLRCR